MGFKVKNKPAKLGKLNRVTGFDIFVTVLVVLVTIIVAYPLYFVVIASFSKPDDVELGKTLLWVSNFRVTAYVNIFKETRLWIGYRNTICYTFVGVLYNLVLTFPAAYVLSKKNMPFHGAISWYFFITMYIAGGLIPSFILMKNIGLFNNPLSMILGTGVSIHNLIICRQFFSTSIPGELCEASYVDGCNDWQTFVKICLPLAKPIIAVMALYYGVGRWNTYTAGLYYLIDEKYFTLQQMIRLIMDEGVSAEAALADPDIDAASVTALMAQIEAARSMQYAVVFVACAPLLAVYPFLQKYFVKGAMIGSVKG